MYNGTNQSSRPARAYAGALVGRAGELAALAEVAGHPPAVAVLAGEAGVGKSRLVSELRSRPEVAAHRFAVGACRPIRDPFPLAPVLDVARVLAPELPTGEMSPVTGALRPLLPELSTQLPKAPPPLDDRASQRHRVFRGLVEILAAAGPSVVVLEDLHWADVQTVEFLGYLLAQPPPALSTVFTFRPDEVDQRLPDLTSGIPPEVTCRRLDLSPLDAGDTGALAAVLLGLEQVPEAFATRLRERSSGLPLAVEELVALLRDREVDLGDAGRGLVRALDQLAVPHAIRAYVLERVRRLPPASRPVVEAVAVLQHPYPERVVAGVLADMDRDEVTDGLSQAIRSGLLVERDDTISFRHVLAAQAVYDDIPGPHRRRLHDRAADVTAQHSQGALGQVAHHLRLARRQAEWASAAERAADHAATLGHDDEATRLLADVLRHAKLAAPDQGRVATKLAQAAVAAGRGPDVLDQLWAVLGAELPGEIRGELRVRLAVLLDHAGGDLTVRRGLLAGAASELQLRPDLRAWAMLGLAIPRAPAAWLPEHLEWLHQALALLPELADAVFDTYIRGKAALVLAWAGDQQWRTLREHLLARTGGTPRHPQEVIAYESLTMAGCYAGHYREAEETLAAAMRAADTLGSERPGLVLRCVQAMLDYYRGCWEGLPQRLAALHEQLDGQPRYRIDVQVIAGCLCLAQADPADAIVSLQPVVDELYAMGAVELVALPAAALVRAMLGRGDPSGASDQVDRLLAALPRGGAWVPAVRALPAMTEALVAAGRAGEAAALVRRLAGELATSDTPLAPPALRHARGLVDAAGGGKAAADLAAAAAGYDEVSSPYEAAQAREQAALVSFRAGIAGGQAALLAALDGYQRLGATWDLDRASHVARRYGVAPPTRHRGGRRGYGPALSPRERQVAELAATGRTNREIARELYVEADTVNKHLRSAMRKLGVRSRTALAHRLAVSAISDEGSLPHLGNS